MTKIFRFIFLFLLLAAVQAKAQTMDSLRSSIEQLLLTKKAVVGVSISGIDAKDTMSVNGLKQFPLQSVFKFHIGLTMLAEIDKGRFSLGQKIEIRKKDLLPDLYSPIRDQYPGGATLTLADILEYTIAQSDNVGCELLLRLLGGPQKVEQYFRSKGFKDISIKINEEVMQGNWDLQFQNWITPITANRILQAFYYNKNKLLFQSSYDFVWKTMRGTLTGQDRLKGMLPEGTVVAHKTGSSGTHKTTGITAAVNDIGVVFLPNGQHFFISVLVTDSREDASVNEQIIAEIARAAWDYFTRKPTFE